LTDWRKLRKELLENPEVRGEYERARPEFELASLMIALRKALGLSQRELARAAGLKQPQIARIEAGTASPTWQTLSKIFDGVDAKFEVTVRSAGGKLVKVSGDVD